jgi:hypothetical protein
MVQRTPGYSSFVKRDPAPSPFERFDELLRRVVAVPKSELDKREAAYKRQRKKRPQLTARAKKP